MSIIKPTQISTFEPYKFNIEEQTYPIGGKMLIASLSVTELEIFKHTSSKSAFMDEIKKQLALELAKGIMQNKLCEFTMQDDVTSLSKHFRARCYLAPDDQVKILRIHSNK